MTKIFHYKKKNSWSVLWMLLSGICAIAYSLDGPFNIRSRRFTILKYPYSMYFVIASGLFLVVITLIKIIKMLAANKPSEPILLSDNELSFNHIIGFGSVRTKLPYTAIIACNYIESGEEGPKIVLNMLRSKNEFVFLGKYFETYFKFFEFKTLMEARCSLCVLSGNG